MHVGVRAQSRLGTGFCLRSMLTQNRHAGNWPEKAPDRAGAFGFSLGEYGRSEFLADTHADNIGHQIGAVADGIGET